MRADFAAKNVSVVRRKCSRRCTGVIVANRFPAAIRQRWDAATASKLLVFVAMDEESWRDDAHRPGLQRCASSRPGLAEDAAGQSFRLRFRNAICSSAVILFSSRLVVRRQRRDSTTASKVFFFVAMDQEGWRHNAQGRVALQDIHRIEGGLAPDVGQMLEIPTHEVIEP